MILDQSIVTKRFVHYQLKKSLEHDQERISMHLRGNYAKLTFWSLHSQGIQCSLRCLCDLTFENLLRTNLNRI